jgi:GT2 family glycosyltransferase
MKFSIVIPTYNRLVQLKLVLRKLNEQEFPFDEFEVLVISDGSTDGTDQYLRDTRWRYEMLPIFQKNLGVASARNAGIQAARGEMILFIDDDTVPDNNLLHEHNQTHQLLGPDTVVLGPMLAPQDHPMEPWVSWEQSRLLEQYEDMVNDRWQPTPRQFYTANASLARKHLLEAGGFDPQFRRAEDVELAYRLEKRGLRFVFNPDAIIYHYAERSFASWVAIPYAYGVNDVIFTREKKQSWLMPTVYREFHDRHFLVRMLVQICLDRRAISSRSQIALREFGLLCSKLNLSELSHLACGGIFNMQYYQGVADALGGREAFFAGMKAAE